MIRIEKEEIYGFEAAIRGMRNSFNSWDKSDSLFFDQWSGEAHDICGNTSPYDSDRVSDDYSIGLNDIKLMRMLAKAGSSHAKFRRMIMVSIDITAPLYFWKEFDTYKVGTVANSCSTMHKIADKEFELDDFSHEHLISSEEADRLEAEDENYLEECCTIPQAFTEVEIEGAGVGEPLTYPLDVLYGTIAMLNVCRDLYLRTKDKRYWWQMIQLFPSSYNQKRTVMLNYEVLSHIYEDRKYHKLDEWREFCAWIEKLPFAEGIIFPMLSDDEKLADAILSRDGSAAPDVPVEDEEPTGLYGCCEACAHWIHGDLFDYCDCRRLCKLNDGELTPSEYVPIYASKDKKDDKNV